MERDQNYTKSELCSAGSFSNDPYRSKWSKFNSYNFNDLLGIFLNFRSFNTILFDIDDLGATEDNYWLYLSMVWRWIWVIFESRMSVGSCLRMARSIMSMNLLYRLWIWSLSNRSRWIYFPRWSQDGLFLDDYKTWLMELYLWLIIRFEMPF